MMYIVSQKYHKQFVSGPIEAILTLLLKKIANQGECEHTILKHNETTHKLKQKVLYKLYQISCSISLLAICFLFYRNSKSTYVDKGYVWDCLIAHTHYFPAFLSSKSKY